MILNLRSPESILAWYRIHPERHGPQLKAIARVHPQFAAAIREAARMGKPPKP